MFKKLFWGVIGTACVLGIVFGIVSIFNSGSEEKAEWSDSTFSTEAVEGREADNEAEDNDNNVNKENSDRASSKDEERVIVDYDYLNYVTINNTKYYLLNGTKYIMAKFR